MNSMSHSKSEPPPANRSIPNLGLDQDEDAETRIFRPENSGVHSQIRGLPQEFASKPLPLIDETKAFRPPPELIAAAKARKAAEKAGKSVPPRARISAPPRPATKSATPSRSVASPSPRAGLSTPSSTGLGAHQTQRPVAASGASQGPIHGIQDDATQVQQVPKELIYQARRARAEKVREKVDNDQPKAVEESHIRRQARTESESVPSIPAARPVEPTHSEVRSAPLSIPPRSNPPMSRRDSLTAPGLNAKSDGKFLWICAAFFMAYLVIVGAGVIL